MKAFKNEPKVHALVLYFLLCCGLFIYLFIFFCCESVVFFYKYQLQQQQQQFFYLFFSFKLFSVHCITIYRIFFFLPPVSGCGCM